MQAGPLSPLISLLKASMTGAPMRPQTQHSPLHPNLTPLSKVCPLQATDSNSFPFHPPPAFWDPWPKPQALSILKTWHYGILFSSPSFQVTLLTLNLNHPSLPQLLLADETHPSPSQPRLSPFHSLSPPHTGKMKLLIIPQVSKTPPLGILIPLITKIPRLFH